MADWDNGFNTFMDTEKESEKWHTGIFRGFKVGLKYNDPRKLRKAIRATNYPLTKQGALDYYHNDEHYHDVPAFLTYSGTMAVQAGAVVYLGQEAAGIMGETLANLAETYLSP